MIIQVNSHFEFGFWNIVIQIILTIILTNVIFGNPSSGNMQLRVSIFLLLVLSFYYLSIVITKLLRRIQ